MVSIESERSQSACQPRASGFFVEKTQPPTVLCFACGTHNPTFEQPQIILRRLSLSKETAWASPSFGA
jgi:hypothetical protein